MSLALNQPKVTRAWSMYDWANSVYSLTITTAVFPGYYAAVTEGLLPGDKVPFLGMAIKNTTLYEGALSLSFLLVALFSPLLSGIADNSGLKKSFMKFYCYLGSAACIGLYFFRGPDPVVELGIGLSMLASIGFSGSLVFYNAYLPEIATPDRFDKLSAQGYALGYVGSVILLIVNLALIMMPETFGLADAGTASRISFVMVGLWWAGFAQIPFRRLPSNPYDHKFQRAWLTQGYKELQGVWRSLKQLPMVKRYLGAFFLYNAGVQTVMYLAVIFAASELGMEAAQLIPAVLIIQLVAIGGAYLFAGLSKARGNIFSLSAMLVIWVGICVGAYFTTTAVHFYILAGVVGVVMGGIQSLSRSTYGKLLPTDTEDHTSYFSFYDVAEKVATAGGTGIFLLTELLTGSMRGSALSLGVLFVVGLVLLQRVRVPGHASA